MIMLLQKHDDDDDSGDGENGSRFPYKSHVIHVISSMAKNDGFDVCRQYFDIGSGVEGLTIPQIRQWGTGPLNGERNVVHLKIKEIIFDADSDLEVA